MKILKTAWRESQESLSSPAGRFFVFGLAKRLKICYNEFVNGLKRPLLYKTKETGETRFLLYKQQK